MRQAIRNRGRLCCWLSQRCVCLAAAVDFYNQINMLYGTIAEFCTPDECPVMSGGPTYGRF